MLALLLPSAGEVEQSLGLSALFALRGPTQAPSDVVVVALDERSEPDPQRPRSWSRRDHAAVVRHLARLGARIVCFDLTFATPSGDPAVDDDFAQALREAGNVLLAESVHTVGDDALVETPPLPLIADAALGYAPFLLPKEARVNRYWRHFARPTGGTPALPLLAHHAHRADAGEGADRRARVRRWMAEPTDGALAFLNFYGPPRSIDTVSHAAVLAHAQADASRSTADLPPLPSFSGKAVFIGYSPLTARAQDQFRDSYNTVYTRPDGLDLSGVEIAATAYANLAQGRTLQLVSPISGLLIVAAWGLCAGGLCRAWRPTHALPALALGICAYLAFAVQQFADASRWWPVVVPCALQSSLALLTGVWLQQREAAHERTQIKHAFSYFLPAAAVEQLTRHVGPITSTNHVVFGACLATDVEKYTTLAEQMPPAALGELMNRYYAELFVPVERSHGAVVDIAGDAMVAVWAQGGAPSGPAALACGAALDIAAALDRFNAEPQGRPPMLTRLGLHTGDMLMGTIGGSGHYEYRAVGDVINTASRIQALNKVLGTRLLASAETVAGLTGFVIRPLGSFLLANKANPVSVVEVLGRDAEAAPRMSLCSEFAEALAQVHQRHWQAARQCFEHILAREPGDGPSRFYAGQCARWAVEAPEGSGPPLLHIDSK